MANVTVQSVVPEELSDWLDDTATRERRPVSQVIRLILERAKEASDRVRQPAR